METLFIEASSIECSEERREISGKIVPLGTGEVGNTNLGAYSFEAGSIEIGDVSKIKLLSQHDMKKPIGRMTAAETRADGIYATFKLSRSQAGSDSLIMASEGLVTGLSIGAEILASKPSRDGHTVVSSARLKEVSLVTEPAFKSAQILEIAAEEIIPAETQPTTESETVVEETTPVEASPSVEASAVEAARPTITAMAYSKPRLDFSAPKQLEMTIKASLGSDEAREYVRAAADTTDNAGLIPTRQLTTVINGLANNTRSAIDAISTGVLPDAGMSFEIPKISVLPTVAETAEAGTPSNTDQNAAFVTVSVKKYAGQQQFSVELFDRSSPLFITELMNNMAAQYAKATDLAVYTAIAAGASADATTLATYPTAAELLGFVSRGAASVYTNTQGFARNILANTSQWANLMTLNDSGRPIYMAAQPQNAGGEVRVDSIRGNVAGLDLYVSANVPTDNNTDKDDSMLIINPTAYTWYESPTYQLRADVIASGEILVAMYGYGAIATKIGAGAFGINKT
jgi:HK97 family phage prohead protease/HK97 family phage major capsid protein